MQQQPPVKLCWPPAVICCRSYSLHNKGNLFEAAKDQIQPVAVDLLNLAANAVVISRPLAIHITQQTALRVCKLYKDPHGLYVSGRGHGSWG